jgi:hypothetical protein
MENKNLFKPLLVIGLFIAFGIISFLVFVTSGQNGTLIKTKLKLGALLLSLSAMIVTSSCDRYCYAPVPQCQLEIKEDFINIEETTVLNGFLDGYSNEKLPDAFCYKICNSRHNTVQSGNILVNDGKIDEDHEEFCIELNKNTLSGSYEIYFYHFDLNQLNSENEDNYINLDSFYVENPINQGK